MRESDKLSCDHLIKEAVEEDLRNTPPPRLTSSEAWNQLSHRLNQERLDRSRHISSFRKKLIYAASGLLLLFGLFAWAPGNGMAFSKLANILHKIQGSMLQIFVGVRDVPGNDRNAPTSDEFVIVEGTELRTEFMNLSDAQKKTSFTITVPKYIPLGFDLRDVAVFLRGTSLSNEIYLTFVGDGQEFKIREMSTGDQFGLGATVDREDTKMEKITFNSSSATLLTYKDGTLELRWTVQDLYFTVEGKLKKEEMINIAKSM
jgi:hypothetical protein